MVELSEILENNKNILIDKSINGSHEFSWSTYNINDSSSMDCNKIRGEIRYTEEFLEILRHPNTITIPHITN